MRVLYIAGIGRSGSTLLNRTLGASDGFLAAGELMHFFGRGLKHNELCACGAPFQDCPVWSRVARRVLDEHGRVDAAAVDRFRHAITEGRYSHGVLLPWMPARFRRRLEAYRALLRTLYEALRREAGCRVIVDSSKNVAYARVLQGTPGIRLYVVHLVRDSRGVTFSLEKRTRRPGVPAGGAHLDRHGPAAGSLLWSAANLFAEGLSRGAAGYERVRYTDFVRAPAETVRRVLAMAGENGAAGTLAHVNGGRVALGVQHVLAGNPVRSATGEIPLREDLEWRAEMPPGKRHLVTALTLPFLARYGYVGNGNGARSRAPAGGLTVAGNGAGPAAP